MLGHPNTTLATLSHALTVYDAVRRPFAQRIAEKSRENGMLFMFNYPGLDNFSSRNEDVRKLSEVYYRIRKNWEWAWETTIDEDVARARALLEGSQNGRGSEEEGSS